jgi:hypothetical protein
MGQYSKVFVPRKPFQPSLISADKARSLLKTKSCFTQASSRLISGRLEMLSRDKHSSLIGPFVNNDEKIYTFAIDILNTSFSL